MFEIIIASHGPLAEAMLESAEMIVGSQENVKAFVLEQGCDIEQFEAELEKEVSGCMKKNEDVLIFTDILAGTPCNTTIKLMSRYPKMYHFCGINMPLLLESMMLRQQKDFESICEEIVEMAPTTIVNVNALMENVKENFD